MTRHTDLRVYDQDSMTKHTDRHHPPPELIARHTPQAALRLVAAFEAVKGIAVLALAFGIIKLLHKDVADMAYRLVEHLHLNPQDRLSGVFLRAAENVTHAKLWAAATAALVYSMVRFVEAFGLWNARVWAEWFALLSGSVYLPWEIYELIVRPSPIRWGVFASNITIVVYMLSVQIRATRRVADWNERI